MLTTYQAHSCYKKLHLINLKKDHFKLIKTDIASWRKDELGFYRFRGSVSKKRYLQFQDNKQRSQQNPVVGVGGHGGAATTSLNHKYQVSYSSSCRTNRPRVMGLRCKCTSLVSSISFRSLLPHSICVPHPIFFPSLVCLSLFIPALPSLAI